MYYLGGKHSRKFSLMRFSILKMAVVGGGVGRGGGVTGGALLCSFDVIKLVLLRKHFFVDDHIIMPGKNLCLACCAIKARSVVFGGGRGG